MNRYQPPFTINNTMLIYVSSISEKLGRISMLQKMESRPYLRRNNRIKSIHSSLKIEANSLSLGQVRDVLAGHMVLGEQKEIQEVKNAYAAYEKLPEINPYSLKDLKKLHGVMTQYTVDESGVFRKGEEGVFNGEKCIFIAPPAKLVPGLMEELFDWMYREQHPYTLYPVLSLSYEFVFIHPFSDGNGRMAGLWHTAILSKWKPIFEYIPIESQIEKFQDGYYQAIAQCHSEGTSNIFIEFMLKQVDMVFDDISKQISEDTEQITEYVKKLLSAMEMDTSYTATCLMKKLGLKSKETFRKNYLNPAMELNLVEMTVPENPRSRNQRYIRR